MLEVLMPIKDRLKELRKAAGMSQQALAVAAGLSVSAVVQLEAGRVPDPRIGTMKALGRALGVPLMELIGDEDEPAGGPPADEADRPKRGKGLRKGE